MTDTQKTKLIDRIRKVLALTTSPNEGEAMAAAGKVQELLAEHNLTMKDVRLIEDVNAVTYETVDYADSFPWRRFIAAGLGKVYFSEPFYQTFKPTPTQRYDRIGFVGREGNVSVAKIMFEYLIGTVERLAKDGSKNQPGEARASYETSFKNAAAVRLNVRLEERFAAARAGQLKGEKGNTLPVLAVYDLALREAKAAMQGAEPVQAKAKQSKKNIAGIEDGYNAGNQIGLDQQVTGRGTPLIRSIRNNK